MSDLAQFAAIVIPCIGYLIWQVKRLSIRVEKVELELDISHHKNFKQRILINLLIQAYDYARHLLLELADCFRRGEQPPEYLIKRAQETKTSRQIVKETSPDWDEQ